MGHLGRTQGTMSHWQNSDWDGSSALGSTGPARGGFSSPGLCLSPSRLRFCHCSDPAAASESPAQGDWCPQARAGSPGQALGPGQSMWDSLSISFGFSCRGSTWPALPGSAQESCLGPRPRWGRALGICLTPWQELEVASSGIFLQIKDLSTRTVSSLRHRKASSPALPPWHSLFPPWEGWNTLRER